MGKGREIHGDIQRKAMRRDALGDAYADKSDFRGTAGAGNPYARQALEAIA